MENIGVMIGLGVTVYLIYDVLRSRGGNEKKVSFMMKKKVKK